MSKYEEEKFCSHTEKYANKIDAIKDLICVQ